MKKLKLTRIYQEDCTIGLLRIEDGSFRCFTLELVYLDNARNVSSIPAGLYPCYKTVSNKFGDCISVNNVQGRDLIRIHKGNYTSQIKGCILVGDSLKDINNDGIIDVTNSYTTLRTLMEQLPEEFLLEVS